MSAVEFLAKEIEKTTYLFKEDKIAIKKAKELEEKQRDEFAISFSEWLINIKNFDDFHKETTTQQLLEIYKKENL